MTRALRRTLWAILLIGFVLFFAALAVFSPSFHDRYFGMARYEAPAAENLDKINALEKRYAASHPDRGFACELAALRSEEGQTDASRQISGLLSGEQRGYKFAFAECSPDANGIVGHYQVFAVPIRPYATGVRAFCTDQTDKLFYDLDGSPSQCLTSRRELSWPSAGANK